MFIYQHLGLGDHIICNGLIRKILNHNYNDIHHLFVKSHNLKTVSHMYSDCKNLKFLIGDDFYARQTIQNLNLYNKLILIGHIPWINENISFEKNFYLQHNINFDLKWLNFKCPRFYQDEEKVYNDYNIKEKYIFIHDDDRFKIDTSKINSNLRIIRPDRTKSESIINFAKIIENAEEVHVIESSFAFLIDLMNIKKFYVHRYCRSLSKIEIPEYKNAKEILL